MSRHRKIVLKIILVGESGVGKTSLMVKYVDNRFSSTTKTTIGADFLFKQLDLGDRGVALQIWDTAGQERFQGGGFSFYRGADGVLLVFDVTRRESLEALNSWKLEFLIQCTLLLLRLFHPFTLIAGHENDENFPMLALANKIEREDRVVTSAEIKSYGEKNNIECVECSASDGTNVEKAFEKLVRKILANNRGCDD